MSDDEGFFEVAEILNKRRNSMTGYTEYLVRWKGYSTKYNTWEPLSNLSTCKDVIQRYNERHRQKIQVPVDTSKNSKSKRSPPVKSSVVKIKTSSNLSKARARFNNRNFNSLARPIATSKQFAPSKQLLNAKIQRINLNDDKQLFQSIKSVSVPKASRTTAVKHQNLNGSRPSSRSTSPVVSLEDLTFTSLTPIPFVDHDYILYKTKQLMENQNKMSISPTVNLCRDNIDVTTVFNENTDSPIPLSDEPMEIKDNFTDLEQSNLSLIGEFIDVSTFKSDTQDNKQVSLFQRKRTLRANKKEKFVYIIQKGECTEIVLANEAYDNSLTSDILTELKEAFILVSENEETSVVLFGSVGTNFCTGISLSYICKQVERSTNPDLTAKHIAKSLRDFVNIIIDFPKPIIGVVQGSAVGLGCAILPLLDCVYASERASFLLPYSTLEQGPEACSSLLLPKIMGYSAANDMLLGGHHITAIEAKSRGLITEVYCHDTLRRNLIPNLKNLTQKSPQVLNAMKALVRNPERAALKHTNQHEYQVLKKQWSNTDTLKAIKNYISVSNIKDGSSQ